MSAEAYIPGVLDVPEAYDGEVPDIPTQIKKAEQAALKRDEDLRLLVVQEAMERELIEAGITQVFVNERPDEFNRSFSTRFFPARQPSADRTDFLVAAETNRFNVSQNQHEIGHMLLRLGFEKGGKYFPVGGNDVEHVIRVASMIRDLERKKLWGVLPNLDRSHTIVH